MASKASIPIPGIKSSRRNESERAKIPWVAFSDQMAADGWLSPDTYGREYSEPGDFPAVYMFVAVNHWPRVEHEVAYVGMSAKLATRWAGHPTLRKITKESEWVKRLFKPTPKGLLRSEERRYIQMFTPPWNIIGRVPGK